MPQDSVEAKYLGFQRGLGSYMDNENIQVYHSTYRNIEGIQTLMLQGFNQSLLGIRRKLLLEEG